MKIIRQISVIFFNIALASCGGGAETAPPAGNLDITFDTDGMVTTDVGMNHDSTDSVAIQADGKIIAARTSSTGSKFDFTLYNFTLLRYWP